MREVEFNINNFNQQLIITGMTSLVDDEGYTMREVLQIVDHIKENIWHALKEIEIEKRNK